MQKKWIVRIVVILFALGAINVCFLPPLGGVTPAPWPTLPTVPDGDNAWVDYEKAQKLLPPRLPDNYATDAALLDRLKPAFDLLVAGAARPGYRSLKEAPTAYTQLPNLAAERNLASLAVAEAARLEPEPGARLLLAVYRMGTQRAEPSATLIQPMVGQAVRSLALAGLWKWLQAGQGTPETCLEVARTLHACDQEFATPAQALDGETDSLLRSMELALVTQPGGGPMGSGAWFERMVGVRLRVYQATYNRLQEARAQLRPGMEQWDGDQVGQTEAAIRARYDASPPVWQYLIIGDLIAHQLMSITQPNYLVILQLFLQGRSDSAATQTFAVLAAYRKRHGSYPSELAPAFAEVKLEVPVDPRTARPIGYRVDNGVPVLWMPGPD
ncbi:MAG: hypothetical protein AB1758_16915, partial [Candidatus Eremiobacterota bacterium]